MPSQTIFGKLSDILKILCCATVISADLEWTIIIIIIIIIIIVIIIIIIIIIIISLFEFD